MEPFAKANVKFQKPCRTQRLSTRDLSSPVTVKPNIPASTHKKHFIPHAQNLHTKSTRVSSTSQLPSAQIKDTAKLKSKAEAIAHAPHHNLKEGKINCSRSVKPSASEENGSMAARSAAILKMAKVNETQSDAQAILQSCSLTPVEKDASKDDKRLTTTHSVLSETCAEIPGAVASKDTDVLLPLAETSVVPFDKQSVSYDSGSNVSTEKEVSTCVEELKLPLNRVHTQHQETMLSSAVDASTQSTTEEGSNTSSPGPEPKLTAQITTQRSFKQLWKPLMACIATTRYSSDRTDVIKESINTLWLSPSAAAEPNRNHSSVEVNNATVPFDDTENGAHFVSRTLNEESSFLHTNDTHPQWKDLQTQNSCSIATKTLLDYVSSAATPSSIDKQLLPEKAKADNFASIACGRNPVYLNILSCHGGSSKASQPDSTICPFSVFNFTNSNAERLAHEAEALNNATVSPHFAFGQEKDASAATLKCNDNDQWVNEPLVRSPRHGLHNRYKCHNIRTQTRIHPIYTEIRKCIAECSSERKNKKDSDICSYNEDFIDLPEAQRSIPLHFDLHYENNSQDFMQPSKAYEDAKINPFCNFSSSYEPPSPFISQWNQPHTCPSVASTYRERLSSNPFHSPPLNSFLVGGTMPEPYYETAPIKQIPSCTDYSCMNNNRHYTSDFYNASTPNVCSWEETMQYPVHPATTGKTAQPIFPFYTEALPQTYIHALLDEIRLLLHHNEANTILESKRQSTATPCSIFNPRHISAPETMYFDNEALLGKYARRNASLLPNDNCASYSHVPNRCRRNQTSVVPMCLSHLNRLHHSEVPAWKTAKSPSFSSVACTDNFCNKSVSRNYPYANKKAEHLHFPIPHAMGGSCTQCKDFQNLIHMTTHKSKRTPGTFNRCHGTSCSNVLNDSTSNDFRGMQLTHRSLNSEIVPRFDSAATSEPCGYLDGKFSGCAKANESISNTALGGEKDTPFGRRIPTKDYFVSVPARAKAFMGKSLRETSDAISSSKQPEGLTVPIRKEAGEKITEPVRQPEWEFDETLNKSKFQIWPPTNDDEQEIRTSTTHSILNINTSNQKAEADEDAAAITLEATTPAEDAVTIAAEQPTVPESNESIEKRIGARLSALVNQIKQVQETLDALTLKEAAVPKSDIPMEVDFSRLETQDTVESVAKTVAVSETFSNAQNSIDPYQESVESTVKLPKKVQQITANKIKESIFEVPLKSNESPSKEISGARSNSASSLVSKYFKEDHREEGWVNTAFNHQNWHSGHWEKLYTPNFPFHRSSTASQQLRLNSAYGCTLSNNLPQQSSSFPGSIGSSNSELYNYQQAIPTQRQSSTKSSFMPQPPIPITFIKIPNFPLAALSKFYPTHPTRRRS